MKNIITVFVLLSFFTIASGTPIIVRVGETFNHQLRIENPLSVRDNITVTVNPSERVHVQFYGQMDCLGENVDGKNVFCQEIGPGENGTFKMNVTGAYCEFVSDSCDSESLKITATSSWTRNSAQKIIDVVVMPAGPEQNVKSVPEGSLIFSLVFLIVGISILLSRR